MLLVQVFPRGGTFSACFSFRGAGRVFFVLHLDLSSMASRVQEAAFIEPVARAGAARVREICAGIVRRRSAFSYMDVARAYVLIGFLGDTCLGSLGVKKAFERGRELQIGHSTIDNWFKRDLDKWLNRMEVFMTLNNTGHSAGRMRHTITQEKLHWLACLWLKYTQTSPRSLRGFVRIVRQEALSSSGMRDLSRTSVSTVHRYKVEIERRARQLYDERARNLEASKDALQEIHRNLRINPQIASTAEMTDTAGDPF